MDLDEERRLARERKLRAAPSWDRDKHFAAGRSPPHSVVPASATAYVPPALRAAPPCAVPRDASARAEPLAPAPLAPHTQLDGRALSVPSHTHDAHPLAAPLDGAHATPQGEPAGASRRAAGQAPTPPPNVRDDDGTDAADADADTIASTPTRAVAERAPVASVAAGACALDDLAHVLELSGLPLALAYPQLLTLVASFLQLEPDEFTLVKLSATRALLALRSDAAASALLRAHGARGAAGSVALLPLSAASEEARRCASTQPLPQPQRPRTTAAGAARLISSSLGLRAPAAGARAGPTIAKERQRRDEERARMAREKADADALWFDD